MKKYKSIIIFLIKFFVTYTSLVFGYRFYLQASQIDGDGDVYKVASITAKVAEHSAKLIDLFGYQIEHLQHEYKLTVKLIIENYHIVDVIEGCNAVSLIILFVAFIIAFSGKLKDTLLFIVLGSAFIYLINIFRIALLTIMIYKYPQYQYVLHSLVFPAIIYGSILLLWVFWVNKFSKLKHEKNH